MAGIIEGILGGIAGGANAAGQMAFMEQKEEMERLREERLSQLRMREHETNTKADIAAKGAEEERKAAKYRDFYERTANDAPGKETTTTYVDNIGDETEGANAGGIINSKRAATRNDLIEYRAEESKKTGDPVLMKQSYDEAKDARAEKEQERKIKADESRASTADRLAAVKELELAVKEKDADTRARRVDALIAKALGNGDGEKDPAKIREVKSLADLAFGGDIQKAVQFAYGTQDKDRSSAVMQMAGILKNDIALANDPDKLIAKAEEYVDRLRGKQGPTRGGVSARPDAPAAPVSAPKPWQRNWKDAN